jgi:SNF2 family DNA or RNA helicase
MNEIKIDAKGITLYVSDPADWPIAARITGSAKSDIPGVFEYTRSAANLNRIYTVFTGAKKPVVKGGSFFMDQERQKLVEYNRHAVKLAEVMSKDSIPIEPNGKFIPYSHQTKIVGVMQETCYSGVYADCGVGKTGSAARAVELQLAKGDIMRGKVLISAPLSILETSWMDDIAKFTHLKAGILWSKISNKDILGEAEIIHNYGVKPADSVSVKKKNQVLWKNQVTGAVLPKLTALERADEANWIKYKAGISYSYNLNGESRPFGTVIGKTAIKENTKVNRVLSMLNNPSYDLFLINHDGVKSYQEQLKAHNFAWVIVDESTKIKNARSSVTQAHIDISWKAKRRNVLTGTPNPNGFDDLWAQFYFLDRGLTLEGSVADFHAEYFLPVQMGGPGQVKWVVRSAQDRDRLIAKVKRSSIFLKQRDCIDLPPRTDMRRNVRMTGEQERAYLEMEEQLLTEFMDPATRNNIRSEAVNVLSKMMKLRQITSGYIVGEESTKGVFDVNPKLEDLDGFIDELGDEKLVIACQFKQEIYTLLDRYKHLGVAAIFGDEPVHKRNENIRDFQTTDKIKIMVLQPQAAAHGITLTAASYLLFLSLDYNFEYYYQTAKRIERLGQKSSIFVIHSLASLSDGSTTVDHDLMDVLGFKAQGRDILFDSASSVGDVAVEMAERLIKRGESRV